MFVKPADGRAVRWPGSMRLLKATGENVSETSFWLLALHHGDVVEASPEEKAEPAVAVVTEPSHVTSEPTPEPAA
ncbi:DUF2635 domain-containing protein [Gluconobacter oxydans]|uniref:DUF2635 domain-containing protein n=1 Tax=Gluconobacter oxydans TaxID=442 RepID=UPI0039E880E7